MKKIFAIVLSLIITLNFVACGNSKTPSSSTLTGNSDSSDSSSTESNEENLEEVYPEVNNDGYCLVVKMKSKDITINSIDDFSRYTVAYISDTDSEIYAEFYEFENSGMYNSGHDLHSGLMGGSFDLGIINKESYQANADDYDIVWDFTKN